MTEIGRSPGSNRGRPDVRQLEYQRSYVPTTKGRPEKGQGVIPPKQNEEEIMPLPNDQEDDE